MELVNNINDRHWVGEDLRSTGERTWPLRVRA
jgi:hypothetical protein